MQNESKMCVAMNRVRYNVIFSLFLRTSLCLCTVELKMIRNTSMWILKQELSYKSVICRNYQIKHSRHVFNLIDTCIYSKNQCMSIYCYNYKFANLSISNLLKLRDFTLIFYMNWFFIAVQCWCVRHSPAHKHCNSHCYHHCHLTERSPSVYQSLLQCEHTNYNSSE